METEKVWDLTRPSTFEILTEELIEKAESELGVRLPERFIELLKIKNGGSLSRTILSSANKSIWEDGFYEIDELFGINDGNSESTGILSTAYLTSEWDLPEKQIVITGDGHWWITLDYRKTREEPTVNWIEPDADRDEIIANNFEEFIGNLTDDNDTI